MFFKLLFAFGLPSDIVHIVGRTPRPITRLGEERVICPYAKLGEENFGVSKYTAIGLLSTPPSIMTDLRGRSVVVA